jgi:hypothetical protein
MSASQGMHTCKRCKKEYGDNYPTCPHCTVTGVDLDSLLSADEMKLMRGELPDSPVCLIDMVTNKAMPVAVPMCKIGRDVSNDIPIPGDRSMSRFHIQIRYTGEDYYIEDCGSRNGTFLNGSPIAIPRKLQNNDTISAGISRYQFSLTEAAQHLVISENAIPDGIPPNPASTCSRIVYDNSARDISSALEKLRGSLDPAPNGVPTEEPNVRAMPQALPDTGAPPPWLEDYSFNEIEKLMQEKDRLNGLIEEIRQDIKQIDRKIAVSQAVAYNLLASQGAELAQAVKQVLELLDWYSESTMNAPHEITLKKGPRIEAVGRIICCDNEPTPKDLEALISQQAVIWCQLNYEPKGIMIVQMRPELSPTQRPQFSKDFLENMRRKKVCVMTPSQLLSMYRILVLQAGDRKNAKELILNNSGLLPGFQLSGNENRAATA